MKYTILDHVPKETMVFPHLFQAVCSKDFIHQTFHGNLDRNSKAREPLG